MRRVAAQNSQRDTCGAVDYWRQLLVLLGVVVCSLTLRAPRSAVAQPSKGGTIVYAVHEGMPNFDIHYETTYMAAKPISPHTPYALP